MSFGVRVLSCLFCSGVRDGLRIELLFSVVCGDGCCMMKWLLCMVMIGVLSCILVRYLLFGLIGLLMGCSLLRCLVELMCMWIGRKFLIVFGVLGRRWKCMS